MSRLLKDSLHIAAVCICIGMVTWAIAGVTFLAMGPAGPTP